MKQDIRTEYTMGLDLGDKKSRYAILDGTGTVVEEGDVATTREGLSQLLKNRDRMLVVMEAGTHSPWVSRHVRQVGHQDLVANPRKVALIYQNRRKRDRIDAITLARLGRSDRELLHPIEHRSEQAQQDLALLRSRDALIRARTRLVAHVRGVVRRWARDWRTAMPTTFTSAPKISCRRRCARF
jgi:transposase